MIDIAMVIIDVEGFGDVKFRSWFGELVCVVVFVPRGFAFFSSFGPIFLRLLRLPTYRTMPEPAKVN